MKQLWAVLALVLLATTVHAQSPHGEMEADCGNCHGAENWSEVDIPEDFDHDQFQFRLRGSHQALDCAQCHASLVFSDAPNECAGCHVDVHQGELGLDCERCHRTVRFIDRSDQLRLHRYSRFPLRGSHYTEDCAACHPPSVGGQLVWVNTPTDCESCHIELYRAAKDPDHVVGDFSRQCDLCHSPTLWRGASFNHASTGFPIDGAHTPLDCSECHNGGSFDGLDPACTSCHEDDYLRTAPPWDHRVMGFGTYCQQCHNTSRWEDANFDHDGMFFPIYSGAHRNEWTECSECHDNPTNFSVFTCIDCHEHNDRIEVDADHSEVSGYSYDSRACFDCHPRGN